MNTESRAQAVNGDPLATQDLESSINKTNSAAAALQKPEGFRVKATGGEAVVQLQRSSGNEGSEALRLLQLRFQMLFQ